MRSKSVFTGSCCAIITPFDKDGNVNFDALEKVIEFQIEGKTDAICACGTTGEASTLNDKEHLDTIEFIVKKVNGRIPVIAGTGSNDTDYAIDLTKYAWEVGADAVLLVTPYYNKATQKGLIKSFEVVADVATKPCILYNVPSRTGCNILPATMAALADHPNIVGVKEASGNLSQVAEIAALTRGKLDIYSGHHYLNKYRAYLL